MELDKRFKNAIFVSSIIIAIFALYCISEMILSWCVKYSYYYLYGRIVLAVCLAVVAVTMLFKRKNFGIYPSLVCLVLFLSIMLDFVSYREFFIFTVYETDKNTLRIFPLIMWFEKWIDKSNPQNAGIKYSRLDITACTIIFVMAVILGILTLCVSMAVKRSKLDVGKANKILCWTNFGISIFLFIECVRGIIVNLAFGTSCFSG